MIKAILFDNNGVLTTDDNDAIKKLAQLHEVSFDEFDQLWKEYLKGVDDGSITTKDFLHSIAEHFNFKVDIDTIRGIFSSTWERDEEMHVYVKKLSEEYTVGLLSNFGDEFDLFEKRWRTSDTIHPENIFVSAKLGMRKPQPEIFHYALKELGILPHEAIFVDDRSENVEAAEKVGMKAIIFTGREQLQEALEGITADV